MAKTFGSHDTSMAVPDKQFSIANGKPALLLCSTFGTCKLQIGGLKTGALSGPRVFIHGKVMTTNFATMFKGCQAYP